MSYTYRERPADNRMTTPDHSETEFLEEARQHMVEQIQIHTRLVREQTRHTTLSDRVLNAMLAVSRHEFVPSALRMFSYLDQPLPIGFGKTISQPFIVALMTDLLDPQPEDRVLEVGTGLGYQAAVLSSLCARVYSVEIIQELADQAMERLSEQSCGNVSLRIGDGAQGWPDESPFDRIIATAAPDLIPPRLISQLRPGGRMVVPAGGEDDQKLMVLDKDEHGSATVREVLPVRFSRLIVSH